MSFGLIVNNSSGGVVIDTTHRLGRVIGTFSTGTSDGSLVVSTPGGGVLWASVLNAKEGSPAVQVSGNTTITWTFGSGWGALSAIVIYGVF